MIATELISSSVELKRLVDQARAADRIGLDTEFMREKTYRARLCLLQIATDEEISLIDPLEEVDLGPLGELLSDPEVQVIVHAGRQDFEILSELLDMTPRNVFDVQLAAGFAGHGASLPYGRLAESIVGARLEKGESYTDWCRRPLSASQLHYAADDVRYLLPIADALQRSLRESDRLDWVVEEMMQLESPELYKSDPSLAWRRVSGRGSLSGRQVAILREVAAWREETAARRNLPRGWVVKDPTLIEIARRGPRDLAALSSIRGLAPKEIERSGRRIVEAVTRGVTGPPMELRAAPARAAQARARMLSGLADAIVRSRSEHAGIATELVATRDELEALILDVISGNVDEDDHRLLRGWRRDLGGQGVIDLVEGRIGVKATAAPPYVEEVPL